MIVYVNAEEKRVVSKAEYEFILSEAIKEADDPHNFFFWLEDKFTTEEIWGLSEHEKYLVRQEFLNFLRSTYEESYAKSWIKMNYDIKEEYL